MPTPPTDKAADTADSKRTRPRTARRRSPASSPAPIENGLVNIYRGDSFPAPSSPPAPIALPAPVYDDGRSAIYCGDALQLLLAIPDGSIDLVATDPPYSSGGLYRGDRSRTVTEKYSDGGALEGFTGDERDQRAWSYWCTLWLTECFRVARPGALLLLFTDWRQLAAAYDAVQAGGWRLQGLVAWDKTCGRSRPRKGGFRQQCEFIVWASAGGLAAGDEAPCLPGVFTEAGKAAADRKRVAEKPIRLMRRLVEACPVGGTVLDPFIGTGVTIEAAAALGRRAIGMEIHAGQCGAVAARLRELARQRDLFDDDGGAA